MSFKLPEVMRGGATTSPAEAERRYVPLKVDHHWACFFLDTGADCSLISLEWWTAFGEGEPSPTPRRLCGPTGIPLEVVGMRPVRLEVAGYHLGVDLLIVAGLKEPGILGDDVLTRIGAKIDYEGRTLQTACGVTPLCAETALVRLARATAVPPRSQVMAPVQLRPLIPSDQELLFEPVAIPNVLAGRAILPHGSTETAIALLNPSHREVVVPAGICGTVQRVEVLDGPLDTPSPCRALRPANPAPIIPDIPAHMTPREQQELRQLCLRYRDIFAQFEGDISTTPLVTHHIDTGDCRPIKQPQRRQPPQLRQATEDILNQMLEQGFVQPSGSPWSSPVVLVRKKDGSLRFCVDYRQLNQHTLKDAYPLPLIDESLEAMQGAKYFSSMDLQSGYWQVQLDPESRAKTAFSTSTGLYEWKVLPFGLCNAPATFMRLMELVLSGLQWQTCLVYLDDILVFGRTWEEHLARLEEVFEHLRGAQLKLKPSKCQLGRVEVDFLGFVVSAEGLRPNPEKVRAVQEMPVPRTQKEVRSFLGMAGYYRRFIKDFSGIAAPLSALTSKRAPFGWSGECQLAFDTLKEALVKAAVLTFPDFSRPFRLYTDASGAGMGAVLTQVVDGRERPICYASKAFSGPEKDYETTRRELLAIIWAVKKFKHYWYLPFDVYTDHRALSYLDRLKTNNSQVARWAFTLSAYPCNIKFRPGDSMQHADGLSRLPLPHSESEEEEGVHPAICRRIPAPLTLQELPATKALVASLRAGGATPLDLAPYDAQSRTRDDRWYLRDSLVWVGSRVYLPATDAATVMKWIHCHPGVGGHMGAARLLHTYREGYLTPGDVNLARTTARQCLVCQRHKDYGRPPSAPQHTLRPQHPFQIVSIDFVGPYPTTARRYQYILVITDLFSRYLIAAPTVDQTARTVVSVLVRQLFATFCIPETILTDQGPQFEARLVQEVLRQFGVKRNRTSPYHPMSNGLNERSHRTLHNFLRCCVENEREWDLLLPFAAMTYNNTRHAATGSTPHNLIFSWPRTTATLLHPVEHSTGNVVQTHREAFQRTRQAILQAQEEANERALGLVPHPHRYEPGQYVWLRNSPPVNENPKLRPRWLGPFRVLNHGDNDVVTMERDGAPYRVNLVRTKLCHFAPPERVWGGEP